MSGFGAPVRTYTPIPERAMLADVPAAILPCLVRSSTSGVVRRATSNGSPASIFRFCTPTTSYWITSLWPVSRSKRWPSSFSTGRIAAALKTLISAASAAPLCPSMIMRLTVRAAASELFRMMALLLSLPLQLSLQLVEEAPVGTLSEDLLRGGLDEARLAKPERIEAHRVVGIVLFPLPVRHFLQGLHGVIEAVNVTLVHQEPGHPLRFERADVGGLQDGAQRALGGHRVLTDELLVADHHATEVLGPRPVGRGIEEHVADLLGARVLSLGRKRHKRVDLSRRQEPWQFGKRMNRPVDVLVGIESDVGCHGGKEDVGARAERGNGDPFPLQVPDGPDTFLSEHFDAADMNAGQEDHRLIGVDPENHRRTKEHRDIGLARPQCGLGRPQTPFDVLDIAEALALEKLFRHVLRRLAQLRPPYEPDPGRFRRGFGARGLRGRSEQTCQRKAAHEFPAGLSHLPSPRVEAG